MPAPPLMKTPLVYRFDDYLNRAIIITVNFDPATRAIINGNITREPDCLWNRIVWGTEGNTKISPAIPVGSNDFGAGQFRGIGFDTIDEINELQITAMTQA